MRLLFHLAWRRWLWDEWHQCYLKIIKVKGWRTAIVETKGGQRMTITPVLRDCL